MQKRKNLPRSKRNKSKSKLEVETGKTNCCTNLFEKLKSRRLKSFMYMFMLLCLISCIQSSEEDKNKELGIEVKLLTTKKFETKTDVNGSLERITEALDSIEGKKTREASTVVKTIMIFILHTVRLLLRLSSTLSLLILYWIIPLIIKYDESMYVSGEHYDYNNILNQTLFIITIAESYIWVELCILFGLNLLDPYYWSSIPAYMFLLMSNFQSQVSESHVSKNDVFRRDVWVAFLQVFTNGLTVLYLMHFLDIHTKKLSLWLCNFFKYFCFGSLFSFLIYALVVFINSLEMWPKFEYNITLFNRVSYSWKLMTTVELFCLFLLFIKYLFK